VRIEADDRQGLERLLRHCARPPFAADRLEELDAQRVIYHLPKPGRDGRTQIILSPLELIGRIAALVPPPRQHRHRYYGVLAPNSCLGPAVTALAPEAVAEVPASNLAVKTAAEDPPETIRRSPARYLWVMLLARIYEAFPVTCPRCGAEMRIIASISEAVDVRVILEAISEPATPPRIAPGTGAAGVVTQASRRMPSRPKRALPATLTPNPCRSTSTINACPGKAARRGAAGPAVAAFRKHTQSPTENPSPTPLGRPIAATRAAVAAQKGLPLALDRTRGRRDLAAKTVGFPILRLDSASRETGVIESSP